MSEILCTKLVYCVIYILNDTNAIFYFIVASYILHSVYIQIHCMLHRKVKKYITKEIINYNLYNRVQ